MLVTLDQIIRAVILARALLAGDPGRIRSPEVAFRHAAAAVTQAGDVDPALLLAVARTETGYDPSQTSRVDPATGRRVTKGAALGRGPRFCGVMQTRADHSVRRCLAQRELTVGYRVGARELRNWLHRGSGDVRRALAGHCCGNAGFRRCRGRCARYVTKTMKRWEALRS